MRLIEVRFEHTTDGDWLATAVIERDGERVDVPLGSHDPEAVRALAALLRLLEERVG